MKRTDKKKIEEFIRVDHAGERGAVKIYEGQLLALNTFVKNDKLKETIEEMKIHEKEHRDFFEKEIKKRKKLILCGDYNIAHTKDDIKNWRSNQKNSGFLPEEREWMTNLIDNVGLVDAFRVKCKQNDTFTWWSNRGNAYNNNVGWRIDYQMVTSDLLGKIKKVSVYKRKKFSDHAPLIIDYDF